jgi:murein DD-endopeptidase MepM/ murein hydrolase activator NlpD
MADNLGISSDGPDSLSSDSGEKSFDDLPKEMLKIFKEVEAYVDRIAEKWGKTLDETTDALGNAKKNQIGSGRLGLGSFTKTQTAAGLGMAVMAVGGALMKMAPSTMSAVTQRLGADTFASFSGMSSRQAILQANRQVGGGATSAMGPTMAASALMYQGGYTANSLSSKNIMTRLGGISAMTGMTNEQAAGSVAGINGMAFLRLGIKARDSKGNLAPIEGLINQLYARVGGKGNAQQIAQGFFNKGGKGYNTLLGVTGGDQALMATLQSGLLLRAKAGRDITGKDLSNPNKTLDLMGVGKDSPIRANFRFQTSEGRKLAATEQGLVGGYNTGLNAASSVNDAFSSVAESAAGVTKALMGLKGFLETFPNAGSTAGTISQIGSGLIGGAANLIGMRMGMKGIMGAVKGKAPIGPAMAKAGAGKFSGKLGISALAATAATYGLNKAFGDKVDPNISKYGSAAASIGTSALTGAAIGSFIPGVGTGVGAVLGTGYGIYKNFFSGGGQGGEASEKMNIGNTGDSSGSFSYPVPASTRISSPFGNRKGGMVNGKKISSNHKGMDFATPVGTAVTAIAPGHVETSGRQDAGWGNYIKVKHDDGTSALYAHLSAIRASRGQKVGPGSVLGLSGGAAGHPGSGNSTGAHLHFEFMNRSGVRVNPSPYLSGGKYNPGKYKGLSGKERRSFASGFSTSDQQILGLENLSSIGLSSLLTGLMKDNGSIGYSDISGAIRSDKSGLLNSAQDRVSGDSGGMAGGSRVGLMKMLHANGFRGKALQTAFAIALAESGGRTHAHNGRGPDDSYGVFQINMIGGLGPARRKKFGLRSNTDLYDPNTNIKIAAHMSQRGANWSAWGAYTSGAFSKYLDDAQATQVKARIGGASDGLNLPSSSGGNSATMGGGSGTFNAHSNTNITLKMDVKIMNASAGEAERLVKMVGQKLQNSKYLKEIGSGL